MAQRELAEQTSRAGQWGQTQAACWVALLPVDSLYLATANSAPRTWLTPKTFTCRPNLSSLLVYGTTGYVPKRAGAPAETAISSHLFVFSVVIKFILMLMNHLRNRGKIRENTMVSVFDLWGFDEKNLTFTVLKVEPVREKSGYHNEGVSWNSVRAEEKRLDINQVYSIAAAMALVTAAAVYTHILRDSVIIISSLLL